MIITFICDIYGSNNNGMVVAINRLKEELLKRGHIIRIVANFNDSNEKYYLEKRNFGVLNKVFDKNNIVLAKPNIQVFTDAIKDADLVHIFLPFKCGKKAVKICKLYNKPFTASVHMTPHIIMHKINLNKMNFISDLWQKVYNKKIYNHAQCVHCPTNFIEKKLKNLGLTAPVLVASNGVPSIFKYHSVKKPEDLKSKICILSIGRLSNEKKQDFIIEAVLRSKYQHDIQLIFAGKGETLNKLNKMGEALTHKPIIKFFNEADLSNLICSCDLYIHASDVETEGLACIESICGGLVPIISDAKNCATQEYALFRENLFKNNNPYDLASKIDFWIENRKAYEYARQKYSQMAKEFTVENCVNKMESMFKNAINKK